MQLYTKILIGLIAGGVFGAVAGVGNGFLPCDPGCRPVSFVGLMHNVTGVTGFIAMIIAILIIARGLNKDDRWRAYRSYSLVTGVLAIFFLLAFMITSGVLPLRSWRGVPQRLFIGVVLLWIEVMAIRLFRLSRLGPMLN